MSPGSNKFKRLKNCTPIRLELSLLRHCLSLSLPPFCDCSHRLKKSPLPNQKAQKQRASLDRIIEIFVRRFGRRPFVKPENTKTTCLLRQSYRDFVSGLWLHDPDVKQIQKCIQQNTEKLCIQAVQDARKPQHGSKSQQLSVVV